MAATRAIAAGPAHLFDGSARTFAQRPHTPVGNGQPCKRGNDRQTRAEHDHGAQAPGAVSHPRGPAHPATETVRNRRVTVLPFRLNVELGPDCDAVLNWYSADAALSCRICRRSF